MARWAFVSEASSRVTWWDLISKMGGILKMVLDLSKGFGGMKGRCWERPLSNVNLVFNACVGLPAVCAWFPLWQRQCHILPSSTLKIALWVWDTSPGPLEEELCSLLLSYLSSPFHCIVLDIVVLISVVFLNIVEQDCKLGTLKTTW